jgi:hypothetical protein
VQGCDDLLDYLVGGREQFGRHVESERPGGLKIDDKLEFGRLLYWKIGRTLALEDAIDIAGCLPT